MSRPVESCARGRDANQSTRAVSQSASQVRYRPNIVFIFKNLETASPPLNKPYPLSPKSDREDSVQIRK